MAGETVKVFVLPGGRLPKRMSDGAIGFDAYARAIVSSTDMDPQHKQLRKTLFDFRNVPEDPRVQAHIQQLPDREGGNKLVYRIDPGESVVVGLGFATEMPFPMLYWMTPRSGLSSRYNITLGNAPGTVDPDYRGEAGANVVNNSISPFILEHEMRIAQVVFMWAAIPQLQVLEDYSELSQSVRGAGGFGSTGIKG